MGLFSSKGEHHGDECLDRHGVWWAKPNPMGVGSNEPRVIRPAGGRRGREDDNRPTMHGDKSEWRLMSGLGSATRWGKGDDFNVRVTGEKPGGGKQR